MARAWYPIINDEKCAECGACVDKCTHSVYNKETYPRPVVVYPEGCVQGCKGCGSLCPVGAIEYYGDIQSKPESCGCACGSDCNGDC